MNTRRKVCGQREGASLVLVLIAVSILVSLVLCGAALSRLNERRYNSICDEIALKFAAENAMAQMLWSLDSDTNEVDHLGEDWAVESAKAAKAIAEKKDGAFAVAQDESARISFPAMGEKALAELLAECSSLSAAQATGAAASITAWWDVAKERPTDSATNRVLVAEEELCAVPQEFPEALLQAMPFLTVHGDTSVNANTVSREAFIALAKSQGASEGGAEGLWQRVVMSRERGDVFESTSQEEALKLLKGSGDIPSGDEMTALLSIRPFLKTSTDRFRVFALARKGNKTVKIECVWDRRTRRILSWRE